MPRPRGSAGWGPKTGFSLVLSGGGARGLAHAGALRALEHLGHRPAAIVGVSMGAIVGAAYALNPRWYDELVDMDITGFPPLPDFSEPGVTALLRNLVAAQRAITGMYFGWGAGEQAVAWGRGLLDGLTGGKELQAGRLPVHVAATDIETGQRVVLSEGPATDALYASAAIAGLLPPIRIGAHLLVDGGYSDLAPVDVARAAASGPVIAVDASITDYPGPPRNGVQAMLRAVEICQNEHAALRFGEADLVLRPRFDPPVGTLDFTHKRRAVAGGARALLAARGQLRQLLGAGQAY